MKNLRVLVATVGLLVAASTQAGMGKWDAIYGFDRQIVSTFDNPNWLRADAPVVMLGWLTTSASGGTGRDAAAAPADLKSRSELIPVRTVLGKPQRAFTLHTGLYLTGAQAAMVARALIDSGEFVRNVPDFLRKSRRPWSCRSLPGLADLADTIQAKGGDMGSWQFALDRRVINGKLAHVLDIRLVVEIPLAESNLREGLRNTLLGKTATGSEVEEIDSATFLPVLTMLLAYVDAKPAQYPNGGVVLRKAFGLRAGG